MKRIVDEEKPGQGERNDRRRKEGRRRRNKRGEERKERIMHRQFRDE